ncbi:MAG: NAD(P)-dependent oxidoreductase [Nanoarchaeota archaeon]|nr:NAD(P)-dependent oxidoreductase [Nanoarchaeota archaeon]MBU1028045.1 NAD(P)-dependent oxidoreductase [Nanoarchaeota archaeon]
MKKLMVTGGAGFLGYHICKKLSKEFDKIIITDIDFFNKKEYAKNIEYFKLDVRDKKGMEKLIKLQKPDFIIHGAAALPLAQKKTIFQVNLEGIKNILDLSLKNKIKRVVFISSTAVYGIPQKYPICEEDPMVGVGPYGKTKIISEKLCEKYRKKGLCITSIRPKTFIGTNRLGVFQILYDWVETGVKIPIIGNGKNRYQLLEVEDLVDAIYLALIKPKDKVNDIFNVGGEKFKTVYEDVSELCKFANSGARVMRTPAFLIIFALRFFEMLNLSPLYKWVYGTAQKDSFVSIDKIKKQLGWEPRYSNAQALIRSYKWYIDNKPTLAKEEGITHRVPWAQGVLGLFKKIL